MISDLQKAYAADQLSFISGEQMKLRFITSEIRSLTGLVDRLVTAFVEDRITVLVLIIMLAFLLIAIRNYEAELANLRAYLQPLNQALATTV